MGGVRAVVGVVLGIISLAVLSLHIALCIHYPSPLFAVTLLLNPSLWLFLGLIGMGCALLLTHRDQQRKVRAGHCASCHTQYGSTIDTKWRTQEAKWQSGPQCQRGPSRAIYSYNGNLHKFYASYGTINEKQLIEMKHSYLKAPATAKNGEQNNQLTSAKPNGSIGSQNDLSCATDTTTCSENTENPTDGVKLSEGNQDSPLKVEEDNDTNNDAASCQKEGKSSCDENNCSSQVDSKVDDAKTSEKLDQIKKEEEPRKTPVRLNNDVTATEKVPPRPSPQQLICRERRYCDCMARYGAIYPYSQLPRTVMPPQCQRYTLEERAIGRYNRKLLMRCKLKPAGDVPVELFAAKKTSSSESPKDSSSVNTCSKDGVEMNLSTNDNMKPESINEGLNENESPSLDERIGCQNDDVCTSQKSCKVGEEEVASTGSTDSMSLSSVTDPSISKDSINQVPHTTVSSSFMVPLKHISHFSAQTSTSLPLGSPYNGKSKQTEQLEDMESTSMSSDQTASEQDYQQEQDVVSISSKSSLLPSRTEKSMTNKDQTKSPLWRPFKSSRIGRKKFSDEEKSSFEENNRSQQSKEVTGHDSTNEDSQESPSSTLRSVFTNKKTFSKSLAGAEKRKISTESVSSESGSSSAPNEKRSQQKDSSRYAKPKTPLTKKISSAKSQSIQKNSKTMLLSPAKAVRSLVFRNSQKRSARARKVLEDKGQDGNLTPGKLPLLTSPKAGPSPSETGFIATKSTSTVNSSSSSPNTSSATSAHPAEDSSVSTASKVSTIAPVMCSTSSTVTTCTSNSPSQKSTCSSSQSVTKSSNTSTTRTWTSSLTKDSTMVHPSGYTRVSSSDFKTGDTPAKTSFLSSVKSSTSFPAATVTTSMTSSSSPCGSPSVRPKEPKKPRLRLKGKHRARAAESIMLLNADSDE